MNRHIGVTLVLRIHGVRDLQGSRKPNSVDSAGILNPSVHAVFPNDEVLSVGVDQQADEVGAHVVAALGGTLSKM